MRTRRHWEDYPLVACLQVLQPLRQIPFTTTHKFLPLCFTIPLKPRGVPCMPCCNNTCHLQFLAWIYLCCLVEWNLCEKNGHGKRGSVGGWSLWRLQPLFMGNKKRDWQTGEESTYFDNLFVIRTVFGGWKALFRSTMGKYVRK